MIVGIDPGLRGALAFLSDKGKFINIFDVPIMANGKATGTNKNIVNVQELNSLLQSVIRFEKESYEVINCWIENVHSMPGQGVASAFNFGHTCASIATVIKLALIRVEFITPQAWKKHFKISSDKEVARALAIDLFPDAAHLLSRKKDEGRAEALLIARYAYETRSK
jgi:crossover junction endodeoxyribonuclease RuvC